MNITVKTTTGEKITPLLTLKSAERTVKRYYTSSKDISSS